MTKELFISSSPHETKVAVLEDDELVEVYYERESEVGLVGSIYKGRVSRVLPGMQSAFVNIGLERDAFLYVTDFVEDEEEYDKIFSDAEARATRAMQGPQATAVEPAASVPLTVEPARPPQAAGPPAAAEGAPPSEPPAPAAPSPTPPVGRPSGEHGEHHRHDFPRGRRRRRPGRRDFRAGPRHEPYSRPPEHLEYAAPHSFEILPGESLAKYRDAAAEGAPGEGSAVGPPSSRPEAETPTTTTPQPPTEATLPLTAPQEQLTQAGVVVEAVAPSTESAGSTERQPVPEKGAGAFRAEAAIAVPVDSMGGAQAVPATEATAPATTEPVAVAPQVHEEPAPAEETLEARPSVPEQPSSKVSEPTEPPAAAEEEVEGELDLEPPAPDAAAEEVIEDALTEETSAAEEGAVAEVEEAGQPPATPAEGVAPVPPGGPAEQTYTLRESYQRPRFAPRRRGRRGGGRPPVSRYVPPRAGNNTSVQISEVLKEGQEILVQIAKEPLGTKGARITSHIALPGRYLVFMPTIDHIGVSRKITSEEERFRLRNIILENRGSLTGGFIVRTAGAGRSEEELKADLKFLSTLWNDIRAKADRTKAPALLHRDLDLVQRILRDTLSPDFKEVRVDNEIEYERCVEFVNRCQPSLVGHVKLYTRKTPLFEECGVQQEVDKALKPKVWLKSGGYIVINQTEALVAIDVNTGKYVGKTNRLEDTIVKTNVDAVNEIVRQVRLRDLGGIIVIDFIDMDERRNRLKVVQALEEALRRDRAPTKVLSFNDFGLVAVTRKRVKQSLERTLCQPCTYCLGSGWIKSVATVCHEIVGEVKKMAGDLEGNSITLRVNPEVAQALKSRQGALLSELESLTHKDIIIKSDPTVPQERFEIY
ncbi:MAG: Rne/Rng family ribonuclease [Acidobacteriia bacterium]|nr:Rne/Rng family ribonuclease [Terriglobia bacterium]